MFYSPEDLLQLAQKYCYQHRLKLVTNLGHGLQGKVFATNRESAIKVHAERAAYLRERDVYQRLTQYQVRQVRGLIVPSLLGFDDTLLIVEMSLVSPPFIVDFGGAYLDAPASHATDPQLRKDWIEQKQEQFGEDWPRVTAILADLEQFKIFVADVHPGNIRFDKRDSDEGK